MNNFLIKLREKCFVRRKTHLLTVYYAVDECGQGWLFESKPHRNMVCGWWYGDKDIHITVVVMRMEALGFVLPDITWDDDPVELTLSLSYGKT